MRATSLFLAGVLSAIAVPSTKSADVNSDLGSLSTFPAFSRLIDVVSRDAGAVAALGELRRAKNKVGLVLIARDGKSRALPPLGPKGATTLKGHDLVPLDGGDFVVVGTATLRRSRRTKGWAARVSPLGVVVWSKLYGARDAQILSFGAALRSGMLLLGGQSRKGTRRRDRAKATIYLVDAAKGTVIRQASHGKDYLRAAFTGAAELETGEIVLAGWARKAGSRSGDDVWVVKARADAGAISFDRDWSWDTPDDDRAVAIQTLPGGVLVASTTKSTKRAPQWSMAFKLDPDLYLEDQRFLGGGGGQGAILRFAAPMAGGGAILVGGTKRTVKGGAAKGWAMGLAADMRCTGPFLWSKSSFAEVTGGAETDVGEMVLVGAGAPPEAGGSRGALVRVRGSGAGGGVSLDEERFHIVTLERGASSALTFSLRHPAHIVVPVMVLAGDADAFLLDGEGTLLEASTNRGLATELLQADLGAGSYRIKLNGSAARSVVSVSIKAVPARPLPGDDAKALEQKLAPARRARIVAGLELLGYRPGTHPEIGFTRRTRRAIGAYQAGLCSTPTGWLSEWEALRLSVMAGRAASAKAARAAAKAELIAAKATPAKMSNMTFSGSTLDEGMFGVATFENGQTYKGRWSAQGFQPHGYGIWGNQGRTWSGEFKRALLDGYASFEAGGDNRYVWIGEFTGNETENRWYSDGYGIGIGAQGPIQSGLWGDDANKTTIQKKFVAY